MKQECSLCGFVVDTEDSLCDARKKRHVDGRHTKHNVKGERPQHKGQLFSKAMGGLILGNVKWVRIW